MSSLMFQIPKQGRKKVRKSVKGKKKVFSGPKPDIRNYGNPEPVRKVYSEKRSKDGKARVKFGTRVVPKRNYNPLSS